MTEGQLSALEKIGQQVDVLEASRLKRGGSVILSEYERGLRDGLNLSMRCLHEEQPREPMAQLVLVAREAMDGMAVAFGDQTTLRGVSALRDRYLSRIGCFDHERTQSLELPG